MQILNATRYNSDDLERLLRDVVAALRSAAPDLPDDEIAVLEVRSIGKCKASDGQLRVAQATHVVRYGERRVCLGLTSPQNLVQNALEEMAWAGDVVPVDAVKAMIAVLELGILHAYGRWNVFCAAPTETPIIRINKRVDKASKDALVEAVLYRNVEDARARQAICIRRVAVETRRLEVANKRRDRLEQQYRSRTGHDFLERE